MPATFYNARSVQNRLEPGISHGDAPKPPHPASGVHGLQCCIAVLPPQNVGVLQCQLFSPIAQAAGVAARLCDYLLVSTGWLCRNQPGGGSGRLFASASRMHQVANWCMHGTAWSTTLTSVLATKSTVAQPHTRSRTVLPGWFSQPLQPMLNADQATHCMCGRYCC